MNQILYHNKEMTHLLLGPFWIKIHEIFNTLLGFKVKNTQKSVPSNDNPFYTPCQLNPMAAVSHLQNLTRLPTVSDSAPGGRGRGEPTWPPDLGPIDLLMWASWPPDATPLDFLIWVSLTWWFLRTDEALPPNMGPMSKICQTS